MRFGCISCFFSSKGLNHNGVLSVANDNDGGPCWCDSERWYQHRLHWINSGEVLGTKVVDMRRNRPQYHLRMYYYACCCSAAHVKILFSLYQRSRELKWVVRPCSMWGEENHMARGTIPSSHARMRLMVNTFHFFFFLLYYIRCSDDDSYEKVKLMFQIFEEYVWSIATYDVPKDKTTTTRLPSC